MTSNRQDHLITLDEEEMFAKLQQFSQANLRAMQQNKWEDFDKNRKELFNWFLSHGIILASKENHP